MVQQQPKMVHKQTKENQLKEIIKEQEIIE
jgi:hypothetical protein